MDFLKWILQASLALALMFLGMDSAPDKEEATSKFGSSITIVL